MKRIKELFANAKNLDKKIVKISGWVRNNRAQKAFGFIDLNDGTCFETLQIVYEDALQNFKDIQKIRVGSSVEIEGELVLTPGSKQPFEIKATSIVLIGDSLEDYPIQPKRHTREFLRENAHLRMRTNLFNAVFRVRSVVSHAIHKFFQDRGFVYVIAHIRGGQEMGRHWYEDGKLLKKKNTFTDFNDCAEYLIKEGYTQPEYLFAQGGSAGGLLMGAIANMRPDLYRGIIANVPWVDVVTTMLDSSIPLTTSEYDEWGNPANKEYYDYMLSYSPYDNVTRHDYPAMLVTTGLHDSQVQYFEPAKWVAKLRDMKTDNHILIMNVNMEAGHGGASGRFKRYKETALEYAFIFDLLGISE